MPQIFLSYHFDQSHSSPEGLVHRVCYHLNRQAEITAYAYAGDRQNYDFAEMVGGKLRDADRLVMFLGRDLGQVQIDECAAFCKAPNRHPLATSCFLVSLPGACPLPASLQLLGAAGQYSPARLHQEADASLLDEDVACDCARAIVEHFLGRTAWLPADGLPIGYPFDYEKKIIEEYAAGGGRLLQPHRLQQGCPQTWPVPVKRRADKPNPVPEELIGKYRDQPMDPQILVDTRSEYHQPIIADGSASPHARCLMKLGLSFPEARPRQFLRYPRGNQLRVGILVSGGIAPGINAVIEGIVLRHALYQQHHGGPGGPALALEIRGYRNGLLGLHLNDFVLLSRDGGNGAKAVMGTADLGGSIIGTSRLDELIDASTPQARARSGQLLTNLVRMLTAPGGVDILYVIGGDGSMRAAHAIYQYAETMRPLDASMRDLSVVGIPKTMDNDILWVWQAFGFLSAVEKAREFVYNLHTEASSNPRLGIIQLFGSDSGFVVSYAALASGVCDAALIPEVPFTLRELSACIRHKLQARGRQAYAIILMAETAIPLDVADYLDNPVVGLSDQEKQAVNKYLRANRRVQGQTPDDLRQAGLKIVSRVLEHDIRQLARQDTFWRQYRVFCNEPRHVLRSIEPSTSDIVFGQRLGALAVDNAMAGYTDFMISQWLTEYVLVPLPLVVLGRKRVPPEGIFWKSVLARTGQGALGGIAPPPA